VEPAGCLGQWNRRAAGPSVSVPHRTSSTSPVFCSSEGALKMFSVGPRTGAHGRFDRVSNLCSLAGGSQSEGERAESFHCRIIQTDLPAHDRRSRGCDRPACLIPSSAAGATAPPEFAGITSGCMSPGFPDVASPLWYITLYNMPGYPSPDSLGDSVDR
jgi:hypothetical protein